MKTRELLEREIGEIFKEMSGLDQASDAYKTLTDRVTVLLDRLNDMDKTEKDYLSKVETKRMEIEETKDSNKKNRYIKIGEMVMIGVGGVCGYIAKDKFANKLIKFEKTGIITTTAGRTFFGGLFK